ncbi:MAG: molecular chaperone DnaK [Candidatus Wildermuthbacteria bacterium]|nr:molecular chaperone DnaK [Candidatus Wildermuthbacteria bacterium]
MSKILGIDLGTTFSAMAIMEGGEPKIIENREGARTTPSIVAVSKNGEILVGVQARRQQVTNPKNTIFVVKRLIGRRFSDPEVQKDKKLLPYEIREAQDGGVEVKMQEKWYKPAEISAMVLRKLKQDAEDKLGEKITEAIITVPAYFDDSQRKATKLAGEIAGLEVKRVINEPTSAALAYGLDKKKDEKIVVYDFGGGTFDISILEVSADTIEVKATGGDTHLGGEDFDQEIMQWIAQQYKKDAGIDLLQDPLATQRIKEAAERAKIELSTSMETEINLPFITSDASGPKHLLYKLTRQTRMPAMQEEVKKLFGKDPNKTINPDEVVAIGAAIQGGILRGEVRDVLLLDVTPLSLGIETLGSVNTILIAKNTTIPTSKSQVFSTAADNQTSVEVHVVQGERPMAQDNKSLGRFILDGIPPAPRGIPQVEVTFDIDANGILSVTAKDKASGKSQSIRIEGSTGMSQEEVERLKKEAQLHEDEDIKKKELIEVRNSAESLQYTVEKMLQEHAAKISEGDKRDLEEKTSALKKAKDGDSIEAIKEATNQLSQAAQKVGAELYKNNPPVQDAKQEKGPGGGNNEGQQPEEGHYKEQ